MYLEVVLVNADRKSLARIEAFNIFLFVYSDTKKMYEYVCIHILPLCDHLKNHQTILPLNLSPINSV